MKLIHKEEVKNLEEYKFDLTDELREAEKKFYTIFDINPCPMSVHDIEHDYVIIDVNQSFLDTIGFSSKNDIIGKKMFGSGFDIISHKDLKNFLNKLKSNGGVVKNLSILFKNLKGKKIKGVFSGTLIELNEKKCLLIVCHILSKQCIINSLFLF